LCLLVCIFGYIWLVFYLRGNYLKFFGSQIGKKKTPSKRGGLRWWWNQTDSARLRTAVLACRLLSGIRSRRCWLYFRRTKASPTVVEPSVFTVNVTLYVFGLFIQVNMRPNRLFVNKYFTFFSYLAVFISLFIFRFF